MKKRVLSFILILLSVFSLIPASADDFFAKEYRVVKCKEYITLRDEPFVKAAALDHVPLGATVTAFSAAENDFMLVHYNGQNGYVLCQYLKEVDAPAAAYVELTASQRADMNLFLSNFTESCLGYMSKGIFDIQSAPDSMLVEFAVDHMWFNNQNSRIEWGEYMNGYNVRVHKKYVPEITEKYFGRKIFDYAPHYVDFIDPYYYWQETGGHISDGFASTETVKYLGGDRYFVSFVIFASGNMWDNEDTKLTLEEAYQKFPDYTKQGCAIVYAPNLNDRATYKLTRFVSE